MKDYRPRRAAKARWLQQAPPYILDCFDSRDDGERYTVLFVPEDRQAYRDAWVDFLGMSDGLGVSMWGQLTAHQAAQYRYRVGKQRVRWLDLPDHIRKHVVSRWENASQ